MAAEWIQVSLRAWAPDRIVGDAFLKALAIDPAGGLKTNVGTSPGQSCLVLLVDEELKSHGDDEESYDAFAGAIEAALLKGAEWIQSRPAGVFDRSRAEGLKVDIFVGSWIDQDQFDLDLPAEFLLACGQAGLAITIVTND